MLALSRKLPSGGCLRAAQGAPEGALAMCLSTLGQLIRQPDIAKPYSATSAAGLEEPEPQLRLPDIQVIQSLNPRLHEIILQQETTDRRSSAVESVLAALEEANPSVKRAVKITPTGLRALRIDRLKAILEELGADSRGRKESLVQRLLQLSTEEQQRDEGQPAAMEIKPGAISRQRTAVNDAVAKQRTAAVGRSSRGMPESSLRAGHREMVQQTEFSQIFSPDEVADILAEARAEDIVIVDVRGRCPFTDWMVLATARSQQLGSMLAGAVLHRLKARAREVAPGVLPSVEGLLDKSEWLVVDAGSVVVHVFQEGYREEYGLEELWAPDGSNMRRVQPKQTISTLSTMNAW